MLATRTCKPPIHDQEFAPSPLPYTLPPQNLLVTGYSLPCNISNKCMILKFSSQKKSLQCQATHSKEILNSKKKEIRKNSINRIWED